MLGLAVNVGVPPVGIQRDDPVGNAAQYGFGICRKVAVEGAHALAFRQRNRKPILATTASWITQLATAISATDRVDGRALECRARSRSSCNSSGRTMRRAMAQAISSTARLSP